MKTFILSAFILFTTSITHVKAGDPLARKIGQKFFDAAKELRLHSGTEVIVTIYVNPDGKVSILNTSSEDESVNEVVKRRMESIVLKENYNTGVHRYKLVFRPE